MITNLAGGCHGQKSPFAVGLCVSSTVEEIYCHAGKIL